jgi:hypothetical protein
VFLAEILRFLLIQRVLVDHNLAMECHEVFLLSQSLVRIRGANRISGVGFGGVDPWVMFIPSCLGTTGLTGALDQSDRCGGVSPLWDLSRVMCLTRVSLGRVGAGQFLAGLEVFCLAL